MDWKNFFQNVVDNQAPIILIPLIMWAIAQLLKFIIYSIKYGISWSYLFEYGHMPSSHTSCMSSLVIAVAYYKGIYSPVFAVASIVALIAVSDAIKLRAYIGEYGKSINRIVEESGFKKERYPKLKERVGHTLGEVISGGVLGISGAIFLIYLLEKIK